MCSMCPMLGKPAPPAGKHLPWAGESECDFVDWTTSETGWAMETSCEPSGIAEDREVVHLGRAVYVDVMYSDDAAMWPVPNDDWAIDYEGELPDWLIDMEGYSVRVREDDEDVDLAEPALVLSS